MQRFVTFLLASVLAAAASSAWAQDYPTKPIRVLVPFAPGGVVDTSTRILTNKMTQRLGWTFVVDNRPGGNGFIAVGIAANAAVFTVVDALLLAPLPFGPRGARVVLLQATHPTQGQPARESRVSYAELQDIRGSSRLLEDAAGYFRRPLTLGLDGEEQPSRRLRLHQDRDEDGRHVGRDL